MLCPNHFDTCMKWPPTRELLHREHEPKVVQANAYPAAFNSL
jgi:hypothetical protein